MIQDVEAIHGQNYNISYCRGILARKLTEPRMTPALDDHAGLLTLPRLRREDFSMAYAFPPERLQELQGVLSLRC